MFNLFRKRKLSRKQLESLFKTPFGQMENMNSGGCGLIALLMTEFLEKNNIPYKIRLYKTSTTKHGIKQLKKKYKKDFNSNIQSWANDCISGNRPDGCKVLTHILVEVYGDLYDSEGIQDVSVFKTTHLSRESLFEILKAPVWNKMFRKSNEQCKIKNLRRKVKTEFKRQGLS